MTCKIQPVVHYEDPWGKGSTKRTVSRHYNIEWCCDLMKKRADDWDNHVGIEIFEWEGDTIKADSIKVSDYDKTAWRDLHFRFCPMCGVEYEWTIQPTQYFHRPVIVTEAHGWGESEPLDGPRPDWGEEE